MPQPYPLFPARLAQGMQVSTTASVDVVELVSGHEKRNARVAKPKASYVLPGATRPIDEARSLLNFFHQQHGPLLPFLFDDPFDNTTAAASASVTANDIHIGRGNSQTKHFDLVSFAGRPIRFPVLSTLLVAINGEQLATNAYTFSDHQLRLSAAPAASSTVSFGCRYLVLVRFVSAELAITQVNGEAAAHGDLHLKEVLA